MVKLSLNFKFLNNLFNAFLVVYISSVVCFNFNFCTQFVLRLTVYNTAIRHLTNTNEIFNVTIIIQKGYFPSIINKTV